MFSKKHAGAKHSWQRNEYNRHIVDRINTGVEKGYLIGTQLTVLYYLLAEHLRKFGYDVQDLPEKTLPPE